jgi:hypothetical protein
MDGDARAAAAWFSDVARPVIERLIAALSRARPADARAFASEFFSSRDAAAGIASGAAPPGVDLAAPFDEDAAFE